jgi:CubicO group peptidase (beta-lactamase class C family)
MKTRLFVLGAFMLLQFTALDAQSSIVSNAEALGMSSERLEKITSKWETYVENKQLSGSVIYVARKGTPVYFEAIGQSDIAKKRPMEKDAIFRIASQSKAIVSLGVMMLQEDGLLRINDPLGKYIEEFNETTVAEVQEDGSYIVVPAKRKMTIRDLLTHTSGLGYGYGPAADQWKAADMQGWYFAHREEPILETVKRMASLPMDRHPGSTFWYGYSTDVLGALIEVVSGQSLDQFLRARVLDPLEMDDTQFYLEKDQVKRLATVYKHDPEGIKRSPDEGTMESQGAYAKGPRMSFSGGAGLTSTAQNYANFLQLFLDKGVFKGKRLVSRKTVELMTSVHIPNELYGWPGGTGFGLGFSVCFDVGARGTLGSEGEFGWGGAYHSTYWVDPKEELVVVYLTQLIPAGDIDDHPTLRNLIYQAITD